MKLTKIETSPRTRIDTAAGIRVFAGDTMIYGDTGWRDVSGYLSPGLIVSSAFGRVRIRRIGGRIEFDIKVDVLESGLTSILERMPIGFRSISRYPMDNGIFTHTAVGGGASQLKAGAHVGVFYNNDQPLRTGASTPFPNPGTVAWTGAYPTDDPWPASLPGTPA